MILIYNVIITKCEYSFLHLLAYVFVSKMKILIYSHYDYQFANALYYITLYSTADMHIFLRGIFHIIPFNSLRL
jgi:hypothetical protein